MKPTCLLTTALLWAASAHAGVLVVDASNGPGTEFVSLNDAITAAQNGDLLLVRSGTYDGEFRILDKAVSIVADAGAQVIVTNSLTMPTGLATLQISGTISGTVVLRDLTLTSVLPFVGPFSQAPLRLVPVGAGAHVWVEGCETPSSAGGGVRLEGSAPITLTRCTGRGTDGSLLVLGGGLPAQPGVTLMTPEVSMFASSFRGGDGLDAFATSSGQSAGVAGAAGLGSFSGLSPNAVFSDSHFEGGTGGDALQVGATCLAPGNGGPGIEVVVGKFHVLQTVAVGGAPGVPVPSCGQVAQPGNAIDLVFLGQAPILMAGQPGRAIAPPPRREGQSTTVVIEGPAGHAAFLVVGNSPTRVFAPQFAGALVTAPNLILALGNLPPSGTTSLATVAPTLPVGVESAMIFIQPVTQDLASGQTTLGAPTTLVVLDSTL